MNDRTVTTGLVKHDLTQRKDSDTLPGLQGFSPNSQMYFLLSGDRLRSPHEVHYSNLEGIVKIIEKKDFYKSACI
ncbi:hypothetical protein [Spirulina sp. 06S082]|uniref:hypothetical protein n=1 Tax=Spirulina sp. 06S082 TaxID=3110248 RepID=UPI002B213C67|nr:hypothetical protein [Spirulina sp. 06S082]